MAKSITALAARIRNSFRRETADQRAIRECQAELRSVKWTTGLNF